MQFDTDLLARLYDNQPFSVDMLVHTDEEMALVNTYNAMKGTNFSSREIYIKLMGMRKNSQLKPKGRKGGKFSNAPTVD